MKPLKITMSAFGPYADETVVDMTKLGSNGLYLITGETGAGKTTIFDAISYALFGKASGDVRKDSMFRSKYAKDEVFTFVELEFLYHDKFYKIRRTPEQPRPKQRGEGYTLENASCTIWDEDNKVLESGVKESVAFIKKIIGLNEKQYKQIAMIAQGDFQKLLIADTTTRIGILRAIFRTEKFDLLQKNIKTKCSEQKKICDNSKTTIFTYAKSIILSEDNPSLDDVSAFVENDVITAYDEVDKLFTAALEFENKRLVGYESAYKTADKAYVSAKSAYDNSAELFKIFNDFDENTSKLARLKPLSQAAFEKLENEKNNVPLIADLTNKIAELDGQLKQFDEVEKLINDSEKLEKNSLDFYENVKLCDKRCGEIQQALQDNKELVQTLKNCEADSVKIISQINNEGRKLDDIKSVIAALNEAEKSETYLKKCREKYVKLSTKYKNLKNIADQLENAYFNGQVGIIAEKLCDNEPCPVCGSISHPEPAKMKKSTPDKPTLDKARGNADYSREETEKCVTEGAAAKTDFENKQKAAQDLLDKILPDIGEKKPTIYSSEMYKKTDDNIYELEKMRVKTQNDIQIKNSAEIKIPQLEIKIKEIQAKQKEYSDKAIQCHAAADEKKTQAQERKKNLPFESRAEGEKQLDESKLKKTQLENAFNEVQESFNSLEKNIAVTSAVLKNISGQLDGKQKPDIKLLEEKLNSALDEKNNADKLFKDVNSRSQGNIKAVTSIKKELVNNEKQVQKLCWLNDLSNTASGQISQNVKISLETYVQMAYFDKILCRANKRLFDMTNGQYELVRDESGGKGNAQTGLDLNVIDHYIGSERSAKSLSGGESFMASLSLALGLSDEIQCSSGGVQIDSMFIDEGFGTLGEATLNQALKTLDGLAADSSLIGIISHVGELKEKITNQIVIHKDRVSGSTLEIITD